MNSQMAKHSRTKSAPAMDHQPADEDQPNKWSEIMGKVLHSDSSKTTLKDSSKSKAVIKKKRKPKTRVMGSSTERSTSAQSDSCKPTELSEPSALIAAADTAMIDDSAAKIEKERHLRRAATRGVVQLFNMLMKQQITPTAALETRPVKPISRQADDGLKAVTPRSFLEMLAQSSRMQRQAGEGRTSEKVDKESDPQLDVSTNAHAVSTNTDVLSDEPVATSRNNTGTTKPKWDILRNDFMMHAHLKDWDQQAESEDDAET